MFNTKRHKRFVEIMTIQLIFGTFTIRQLETTRRNTLMQLGETERDRERDEAEKGMENYNKNINKETADKLMAAPL